MTAPADTAALRSLAEAVASELYRCASFPDADRVEARDLFEDHLDDALARRAAGETC